MLWMASAHCLTLDMNESPHQSDSLSYIYKDKTVKERTTLVSDILKEHN